MDAARWARLALLRAECTPEAGQNSHRPCQSSHPHPGLVIPTCVKADSFQGFQNGASSESCPEFAASPNLCPPRIQEDKKGRSTQRNRTSGAEGQRHTVRYEGRVLQISEQRHRRQFKATVQRGRDETKKSPTCSRRWGE